MDNSSKIIEDIKYFMFGENDFPKVNCDGFFINMGFVGWVGNSHSFLVNDYGETYRVTVTKE